MLPRPALHLPERRHDVARAVTPHSVLRARPALPADRTDIHRAGQALAEAVARGDVEVCTLVLRLDGLADVRERHGEAASAHLCTELIRRLLRCTRGQDVAGRCDGEDALVLLLPCAPADADTLGHRIAERARLEAARPVQYRTLSLRVACSVGRARWQGGTLEAAIEQAREALRRADRPRMPDLPARLVLVQPSGSEPADTTPRSR